MSDNFKEVLLNEDDIGKVIKSHIHIENLIHEFIGQIVVDNEPLKAMNLDYYSAIHLAVALGLPKRLLPPLKCLGSIRNKFAHHIDQKLSKDQINAIYKSFDQTDKLEINTMMESPSFSWVQEGKTWRNESVGMQYTVLCMHLYYSVKLSSFVSNSKIVL